MVRGKLILICQSGGTFATNDDGSLSYTGGDAQAVDINHETLFDELKFKFAEMWNLEYKSLSVKYFLPGNRRTLITLSNDRDLKRMYDFHGGSVTADVFVTGREGFDPEALNMHNSRACGIKLAETVTATMVSQAAATTTVVIDKATTPMYATLTATPASVTPFSDPVSIPHESVIAFNAAIKIPGTSSNLSPAYNVTHDPCATSYPPTSPVTAIAHSPDIIDMSCTPADTVKKRRRTAFLKIGANGPTVMTATGNVKETRKTKKRYSRNPNTGAVADYIEQKKDIALRKDDSHLSSNDVPLEDLVASWKDGITGEGQEFKSVKEFRDALQKYAIAHRFAYKLKKNDTNRASGRCMAEDCSWRIHASWVPSAKSFKIKKMNKSHTCEGVSWKSAHPAKNWLVSIIKNKLQDSPHHKPKDIANCILRDFGIELKYTQVWRGIEDAREQLQGSYKEAYNQLPWFCEKMMEANPGSFAKLFIADDKRFQRLFISFHASIHGFQNGCRPLLFLDAISLKSKFQEMMLTATALDGDDGLCPVAFAVVDIENDDSWHWFLEQLRSAVSTSRSITFVSDREKGLKKPVLEVFKSAFHGYSIYHLADSFKKNSKGPFYGDGKNLLPGNFLAAAHAVRLDAFKMFTEHIRRASSNAYDWVTQIEPEYWTNAAFKGERYNHITFNVAEAYTQWVAEVRELPMIQKLESVISKMMDLINNRRVYSSRWSTRLTPSKERKLQEESQRAHGLKVLFSSATLFEVHDDSINVVDIDKRDCSCLGWKGTGFPCHHAIAVFNCTGRSVYEYCSRYFTVDSLRATYSESINPVPAPFSSSKGEAASDAVRVLPPSTSRPPSQPKKKSAKKQGGVRKAVSCARCKRVGHNKATCKVTS